MRFYGRGQELKLLAESYQRIGDAAEMVSDCGKTKNGQNTFFPSIFQKKTPYYLFISKKICQTLLCSEFIEPGASLCLMSPSL